MKKFRGFLPMTDRPFFERFEEMATAIVEAGSLLAPLIASPPEAGRTLAGKIKLLETRCDGLVGSIIVLCEEAQGPPFEPEDIIQLAKAFDDVMDWIERFASRFMMYREAIDRGGSLIDVERLAQVIVQGVGATQRVIRTMGKSGREIEPGCIEIHRLESQADAVFHAGLINEVNGVQVLIHSVDSELTSLEASICGITETSDGASFREALLRTLGAIRENRQLSREIFRFIILREVLKALEAASDATDTVAILLRRMVMKNG